MGKPTLRYDQMVESALRGVVRDALALAAEHGLPGAHHFYITFRSAHSGVEMPDFLRAQYPDEMTIVLEHQFWGLEVDGSGFSVTLSFRSQPHRLIVPFAAITAFADPSVKFGLEFRTEQAAAAEAGSGPQPVAELLPGPAEHQAPRDTSSAEEDRPSGPAEVVKLDQFRRK